MRASLLVLMLIATSASAQSTSVMRTEVADPRPLLIAALNAATGEAYGVLVGETANAITQHFKSTSPIYVDVTTLKRYKQEGCSRLNVRFWQEGVKLPGANAPRTQRIDFGINYCRDGQPPRSLS